MEHHFVVCHVLFRKTIALPDIRVAPPGIHPKIFIVYPAMALVKGTVLRVVLALRVLHARTVSFVTYRHKMGLLIASRSAVQQRIVRLEIPPVPFVSEGSV